MNQIQKLIDRNALFVINDSGGKDSQVMKIKLQALVPAAQLLVIHADLPGMDWDGTEDHVHKYLDGLECITVRAGKTFHDMARKRGMFPSPKYRQCTSDLKRDPIDKAIRHHLADHPEFGNLVVSCMGLRAEESSARAKAVTFKLNKRNSKAGREWYDWLPIHDMLVGEVFDTIADAGQEAFWIYAAGMTRMSCRFCIMSSNADIKTAARLAPKAFQELAALEVELDFTFMMPRKGVAMTLPQIAGIEIV